MVSTFEDALARPKREKVQVRVLMDSPTPESKSPMTLAKSLTDILNGGKDSIERLAFESDPQSVNRYQAVYRAKLRLLPDSLIKRILIQDDLCSAIVRGRETQMASFGRPRDDRHETGYVIETNVGVLERLTPEQREDVSKRIQRAQKLFWTCGEIDGVDGKDRMCFSDWLQLSTRNAVGLGRIATEIVYSEKLDGGEKEFHHFRPVDVGTIYKATPQKTAAQSLRDQALKMLADINGHDNQAKKEAIESKRFGDDEYAWIQVIDGRPIQAFTDDEMRVHNFFPVLDVELDGYPVTPIDTMISAVTTHINITTHNKIYFQTGRAARGMLVFKSDDVDEHTLQRVKQQFNASINSVNNAWRMPVFAVGSNDEISWEAIDNSSRDAEFQYLTDMNARVILSAFQMSPDELPGWAYLSRGTNNQSLSESNNEYRMEAARDQGIRPLLAKFEDFVNGVLFPLIDENLAKMCRFRLRGLDALTAEKEGVEIQTNGPLHMDYDEIRRKVEKPPIGRKWGGEYPLNPQLQAIHDKFHYVDDLRQEFLGMPPDESFRYPRDPFWFQNKQLVQQDQANQIAAQQGQAPGGGGDDKGGGGKPPGGGGDAGGSAPAGAPDQDASPDGLAPQPPGDDLTRSIDQAMHILSKGEQQLPSSKRKRLIHHKAMIEALVQSLDEGANDVTRAVLDEVKKYRRK